MTAKSLSLCLSKNTHKGVFTMSSITKKQENLNQEERKVCSLKEIEKRKIVEHNDLITSVAKMDKVPLKIFELAVSLINTDEPPKENTIYLSKKELFSFFEVSDSNKHSRFKQAIEKMQKQAFFEIKEKKDKGFKMKSIVPIPTVEWSDYNDEVMIRFNQDIMPYLIELKNNFTQYALTDLVELNSKYSIILYKWFSMNYNQYEHYSANGGRRNEQLEDYCNPSITVKELRTMTDTLNEYKDMNNFTKLILKKPLQEINEHTHFNVTYDKIKKGRSIDRIQFHITKKQVAKNEYYKQEQQDPVYLEDKATKEERQKILSADAMQSPYTKILLDNMLLSPYEMTEIQTMAGLQKNVYPLYDELKDRRGLEGVKKHLSYVSEKREGYSKRNIVLYLKTAIEDYLPTVKRQDIENE